MICELADFRLAEDLFGDGLKLHVRGALVDLADLGISIEFLHRIILHEAIAAEQIDRERRHPFGDLRREQLAHRPLSDERTSRVA